MFTERLIQETVKKCVSCLVSCVDSGKARTVNAAMYVEIQDIARHVDAWRPGAGSDRAIVSAVGDEMVARYGPVEGAKLSREFASAFVGLTGPGVVPALA